MIEVKDLTIDFGVKRILDNISFIINDKEKIAIIGPSGEGKSVMLRTILGLIKPTKGTVLFDGIDIHKAKDKDLINIRKKIGVLFQGSALFDFMTVEKNVEFPLRVHENLSQEEMTEKVNESLKFVGLEDTNNKMPDELSGGMQKRVALARAIIRKPEYMFYDEPVSGLDPEKGKVVNELIGMLSNMFGLTSITVTHDMSSLDKIADKVMFLYKGKIAFYDKVDKIKESQELMKFMVG